MNSVPVADPVYEDYGDCDPKGAQEPSSVNIVMPLLLCPLPWELTFTRSGPPTLRLDPDGIDQRFVCDAGKWWFIA